MGTISDDWWRTEFSAVASGPIDYLSRDGKTAVDVQRSSRGSRDFHSAVMQLAVYLEQNPQVDRACLVLSDTRMSLPRLHEEWDASKKVLQNKIARRLGIVVIEEGESWLDPDEPLTRRITNVFEQSPQRNGAPSSEIISQSPGLKPYDIAKILISRWLQRQGPIALGALAELAGCSYPTIRKALDKPNLKIALNVASNRSVELKAFPRDAWRELVALSGAMRYSIRFRDRSGDPPTSQALLKRLERIAPPHIALGGVAAARKWHADFDLHGAPRLDLLCHAPRGTADFSFVKTLDPALERANDPADSAVLVIRLLVRANPLFHKGSDSKLPWADPVETALDLYDLSLVTQANQLLTHLRPEVRLA